MTGKVCIRMGNLEELEAVTWYKLRFEANSDF